MLACCLQHAFCAGLALHAGTSHCERSRALRRPFMIEENIHA
jgi:hypothetical protein